MNSHDPRNWHWYEGIPESLANTEARMAIKSLNIRHNNDNTITVRAEGYRESIEVEGKTKSELIEAVKYAVICQGFEWTDEIRALLESEMRKK